MRFNFKRVQKIVRNKINASNTIIRWKKIPFKKSINGFDLTKTISKSLEKTALVMEVNGQLKDLSHEITDDSKVRIITAKDKEGLEVIRHDAAHIMAMAVQELFLVPK